MMTDPLADMLTRIRNATRAYRETVDIPASRLKVEVARVLRDNGFIRDYRVMDNKNGPGKILRVFLKYGPQKRQVIQGIRRVSTPGRRVYARHDRLPRVLGGLGIAVVSTSKGVMSDREARKSGVGGEVLCVVW